MVNAGKKPHTKLSYSPKFQPLKYMFSLGNSSSKEPKIQHHCYQFEWHSATRPHFCVNIPSNGYCPRFPTTTTLGYGCSLAISFRAKCAQNLINDGSEDRGVDNQLEKNCILLTLWERASHLQIFVLPTNFKLDGIMSHTRNLAAKCSFKIVVSEVQLWASFTMNFFRIADTLEAHNWMCKRSQMNV